MRRSAVFSSSLVSVLFCFTVMLGGCGGGNSSNTVGPPASIVVTPSTASLTQGGVTSLSATVYDANSHVVANPPVIKFTSGNAAVATVSTGGLVCAGTWDANFVVCTPGQVGTATITATSGSLSATATIYSHAKVDKLVVSPATVNCISQGQTQQMSAQALSNGVDVTSTVGPISWTSTSTSVATVDGNGVVTAKAPGAGGVYASVASVNSVPASFITCPVKSITAHLQNAAETSFSVAPAGTQQLAADVLDTAGNPVTVTLTWFSSQPAVASMNASTGVATAVAAGTTEIGVVCGLGTCNYGLPPVYGNVVTGNVSGTSATTVYVTGTGTTSLVPIDTGTNAAGTAVTLPAQPNSFIFNSAGSKGYLGSSGGLMVLDTSNNSVTNQSSFPGTVLAVSPDGNIVIVAGASAVFGFGAGTSNAGKNDTLGISGATAAAFTPDSSKAYIAAGSALWVYTPTVGATPITEPVALTDATMLSSGAFAYFSSATGNSVLAEASCNNTTADTVVTPASPSNIRNLPNDTAVLAVDSPGIDVLTPTTTLAGCPPTLTDTIASKDFLQGPFTSRQLIVLANSSKAYVTSNLGMLLVYDVATATTSTIPLATGANAFTGGATLDSNTVYVGGSDNAVHRINVASGADAQQIPVTFTPELVAVRPK